MSGTTDIQRWFETAEQGFELLDTMTVKTGLTFDVSCCKGSTRTGSKSVAILNDSNRKPILSMTPQEAALLAKALLVAADYAEDTSS